MINGAHVIIYSTQPEADRALLRDVFRLPHVDVGGGWLIFGLPPAEVAVHPSEENDVHEFYFMCEDVDALVAELTSRNIACTPVEDQGWGLMTHMQLPGGGKLGIYQARHARPKPVRPKAKRAPAKRSKKRTARRPAARRKVRRGAR
jgi:hypothetical protein